MPHSLWVIPSLILCASLGFAFEFLFFCVTLRVRHVVWLMWVIRSAIVSFFSGTVIPFRILPFGMDQWMAYQPFGSLGGAPLSLFVGVAEPSAVIPLQVFWNVVIWGVATLWFDQSRERMVSFGG
jgi:ABC-2 type transport system permease protein